MRTIGDILHNIADHTETLFRIVSEQGLSGDFMSRLVSHIALEEMENTATLRALHSSNPTPLTQKLLDHSFFLQKIMADDAMPADLKKELLGHFMEEHQEWQQQLGVNPHQEQVAVRAGDGGKANKATRGESDTGTETGAPAENERGWTVGPMWRQGG